MGKKNNHKQKKAEPTAKPPVEATIPENFNEVLYEFVHDLMTTFPEYAPQLEKWHSKELPEPVLKEVFAYILGVFPERFFDILYQNDEIFQADSNANTYFLPDLDFKQLYHCSNISENTRNAIWKYLQLILVSVLNSINDKKHFGDTMNMFEGVDETVLQEKLSETIQGISEFFKNLGLDETEPASDNREGNGEGDGEECPPLVDEEKMKEMFENMQKEMMEGMEGLGLGQSGEGASSSMPMPDFSETFEKMRGDMPNANDLHEHLKGLFDGKIGRLAKELAEEISGEMENLFSGDAKSKIHTTQDLLKNMLRNPKKMMDIMKTISTKLQQKMKSGDISEQDIMREAGDILGKMKGMGGKDNKEFTEIFKNLTKTMGGGLGKSKMNMGALNQFTKNMAARERLQSKLEQKREQQQNTSSYSQPAKSYVFSVDEDEKQEKSYARPLTQLDLTNATFSVAQPGASDDIEQLAKEIDALGENTKSAKKSKKKKSEVSATA